MRMNRLIFKISQLQNQLSGNDRKIADFLLENKNIFLNSNTMELASLTKTSSSAWNRFSKRLGYKGIVELKVEIAKAETEPKEETNPDIMVQDNDTIESLVEKYKKINDYSIENTIKLIDEKIIEKVIFEIKNADRIFLCGVGASATIAFDFLQKISKIGKVAVFSPDIHSLLPNLSNITKNDLLFSISYSGETKEVVFATEIANEKGAKTVSVTSYQKNNKLSKICDYNLFIPNVEKEIRLGAITSRNSSFFLTDLLYLGLASQDVENTMNHLLYSHNMALKLKGKDI
ncbi:MurR/RpiR family transcriptional regulator [Streptococcus catagoni]|uniref:MurR/RpiR family transcriptional regulator n=1 Tax=Streptococcus catagoni TaxID=2654874 RepID=UPI00140B4605|nr:MurR/RpiR family transcriptional regulator [Streptococcus catagoni]